MCEPETNPTKARSADPPASGAPARAAAALGFGVAVLLTTASVGGSAAQAAEVCRPGQPVTASCVPSGGTQPQAEAPAPAEPAPGPEQPAAVEPAVPAPAPALAAPAPAGPAQPAPGPAEQPAPGPAEQAPPAAAQQPAPAPPPDIAAAPPAEPAPQYSFDNPQMISTDEPADSPAAAENVSVQALGFAGPGVGGGLQSNGAKSSVSVSLGYGAGGVVSYGSQPPADHTSVAAEGRISGRLGPVGVSGGVDLNTDGQFGLQAMGALGIGPFSKQVGVRLSYDPVNGWRVNTPNFDRLSVAAELNGRLTVTTPVDANLKPVIEHLNPFSTDSLNEGEGQPLTNAQIKALAPPGVVVTFAPNTIPQAPEPDLAAQPGDPNTPAPTEAEIKALAPPGISVTFDPAGLDEDPAGQPPVSLTNPGLDEDPAGPATTPALTSTPVEDSTPASTPTSDDTTAPADSVATDAAVTSDSPTTSDGASASGGVSSDDSAGSVSSGGVSSDDSAGSASSGGVSSDSSASTSSSMASSSSTSDGASASSGDGGTSSGSDGGASGGGDGGGGF